jgi:Uma2 family endonuclease
MTADDLARILDNDDQHEIIRGRLLRMPPPQDEQGNIQVNLASALKVFCKQQNIRGRVRVETGFLLSKAGEPDTVLGPDVSYIAPGRKGDRTTAYERIAPDIVAEIASPSQYRPEMVNKGQIYLNAGVRLVWVIWPNSQIVEVWQASDPQKTLAERIGMAASATLTISDSLDGLTILPGFTLPLRDLFEI